MRIEDLMTPNPVTVEPDSTISETLLLMYKHNIRHLPVVEKGRLEGIVSDRDIKQTMGPPELTKGLLDPGEADLPVSKIMTRHPIAVRPGDSVKSAIEQMVENRVSCLPVVDSERKLVGIVSEIDLLRYCLDILDQHPEA
jgi:acetoin utilization protein AcuB